MSEERPKILVVDDDEMFVDLIKDVLSAKGYDVVSAYDGKEAVEKVKATKPGIILLDHNMPGMTGDQVAEKVRGEKYDSYIITTGTIPSGTHYGNTHLDKPFTIEDLLARVEEGLNYLSQRS